MKIKLIFAWYDLWIGFFWDSKKEWLYFFPIPTLGIIFKFFELPENYRIEKEMSIPTYKDVFFVYRDDKKLDFPFLKYKTAIKFIKLDLKVKK